MCSMTFHNILLHSCGNKIKAVLYVLVMEQLKNIYNDGFRYPDVNIRLQETIGFLNSDLLLFYVS